MYQHDDLQDDGAPLTIHDDAELLEKGPRPRRNPLRVALGLASWLFVIASIAALVAFGLGPQTGAYRTLTVLSGSMVPAFSPGDVVIATKKAPKEVKVGDVIVFNEPVGNHHVTTHRVVKIYKAGTLPLVQTKGDANNANDAFKLQIQGNELWYVRGHVPYFGNVIHALRMPLMKLLAFGCLGLLALVVLWQVWFSGDEDEVDDREDWDLSQT